MSHDGSIYVTYHQTPNVYSYKAKDGKPSKPPVLFSPTPPLDEPRGMALDASSNLILVDGGKTASTIYYCVRVAPGAYAAPVPIVTPQTANSINHPFAVAFLPGPVTPGIASQWLVSNQDSNVVASFHVTIPTPFDPKQVILSVDPVCAYLIALDPQGAFLSGTFVASAVEPLPAVPPPAPPVVPESQGGLDATLGDGTDATAGEAMQKVTHSVRDVAIATPQGSSTPVLLALDEAAGLVRMYDVCSQMLLGTYLGGTTPNALDKPTHLLVLGPLVYVSAGDRIYGGTLQGGGSSGPSLALSSVLHQKGVKFSGMAVDPDGNFYVADRTARRVSKYDGAFQKLLWQTDKLPDEPEFLLFVAD